MRSIVIIISLILSLIINIVLFIKFNSNQNENFVLKSDVEVLHKELDEFRRIFLLNFSKISKSGLKEYQFMKSVPSMWPTKGKISSFLVIENTPF